MKRGLWGGIIYKFIITIVVLNDDINRGIKAK